MAATEHVLTKDEVMAICAEMKAAGKEPSIRKVMARAREKFGYGGGYNEVGKIVGEFKKAAGAQSASAPSEQTELSDEDVAAAEAVADGVGKSFRTVLLAAIARHRAVLEEASANAISAANDDTIPLAH